MNDMKLMAQCLDDAVIIVNGYVSSVEIGSPLITKIAMRLFDRRYVDKRGMHSLTDGVTGPRKGEDGTGNTSIGNGSTGTGCTGKPGIDNCWHHTDRVKKFIASSEERRHLCRKLLSFAQWLSSENTMDACPGTVKIYREQIYGLMAALEETIR